MLDTNFDKMRMEVSHLNLESIKVDDLVDIDIHNIVDSMCVQPKRQAQASLLAREAERQLAKTKHDRDNLEYEIRRVYKTSCKLSGERPLNEDVVSECHTSVLWQNLTSKIQTLQHSASVLQSLEKTMEQRYGMIQQISKRRSAELQQLP